MTQLSVPMSGPDITAAEIETVRQVLQTPYLSIGPRIDEFEERFAAYVGARHAVGVSSGTAGLHLCVIAALRGELVEPGVGEGDLVITTPFSFVASANIILYQRAIPVFVDTDPHTLNIDPALVAEATEALTKDQGPRTAGSPPLCAISHQLSAIGYLLSCQCTPSANPLTWTRSINAVAQEYGLAIIEDACEALGAEYKGRRIGTQYPIPNTQYATRNTQQYSPSTPTNRSPPAKGA